MPKPRIALLVALGAPLVLFGLLTAAWAIDRATHSDGALRGVSVAGREVAGSSRERLAAIVAEQSAEFAEAPVRLTATDFAIDSTAAELGIVVDLDRTVDDVLAAGRRDPGPAAPIRWVRAIVSGRDIPLRLDVDRPTMLASLVRLEGDRRTTPVEPTVTATAEAITLVPGRPGVAIDLDAVIDAVPKRSDSPSDALSIDAPQTTTASLIADDTVAALAATAQATTAGDITLNWGAGTAVIPGTRFRAGFRVVTGADGARLDLDAELVSKVFDDTETTPFNPTKTTVSIQNGAPVITPGVDATICCAPDTPGRIAAGLLSGSTKISVDPVTITAAEGAADASSLGIATVVGEFTTEHPAGQPRVTNIHLISDLVRGVIIPPGQTFSVNDFVGRRTAEKGFVVAPVIEQGKMSEDFGGGVSQFATTLFNAAFFGGLDIPDHKAHSEYISRYPFGREATLAFPSVDLKIKNPTPYGVMIWPTYTDSSITVQLWSTPWAVGRQASVIPASGCGKVSVLRDRAYLDGRTDSQTYRANYACK